MKKVIYQGTVPATFGVAGYFATGTEKEVEDDIAALLLGKQGFSEVAEAPAPTKAKAAATPTE